jgi:hypothetical protein
LSIKKLKKERELLFWPITLTCTGSPGTEGKLNVAVCPAVFGSKLILVPPAIREAPPVSTAEPKSSVTVFEVAGEAAKRERVIMAALTVLVAKEKCLRIVGSFDCASPHPSKAIVLCALRMCFFALRKLDLLVELEH